MANVAEVIQEELFDDPEALLDRLSPRHPFWNGRPQEWAFRGHADSSWSLIPSALRESQQLFSEEGKPTGAWISWESTWLGEMATLATFMDVADSVALALPDYQFARNALGFLQSRTQVPLSGDSTETSKFIAEFGDWPPAEVLGILALAQHSGVRTRLLDWSRRANVAAYFAAESTLRSEANEGSLAIWSMREEMAGRSFPPQAPSKYPRLQVVSPALSSNSNMAAQAGFFTVDRSKTAPEGLEVTMADRSRQLKPEYEHLAKPVFCKFLLPRVQARRLLKLLAMEGVHAATLFPGFSGVAKYLDEKRRWL